jgi:hypothetical protein
MGYRQVDLFLNLEKVVETMEGRALEKQRVTSRGDEH